ncbi:MAG: sigma-70 family RNA polymerase sigma factor [Bacteroidales bacterium]|nr:sigma-70 family RNA polymerase sigma factor [Candidatus Colicola faecequi]
MDHKEQQFTKLVQEQKATIYSVCMMFADERTETDDLVQDALIHLWEGFESFEGRSNIKSWVYRVTLNSCISFDRKRKHTDLVSIELADPGLLNGADSGSDAKQYRMLHERIQKLGPFDRAIILLWLEDMSYDEIAAIVGITVKNVSVRLMRIKEQLKQMSNN